MNNLLPEKIKVVLADDHEIIRVGLRRILSVDKKLVILAEASDGTSAIELVKEHYPHIVLMDISMPFLDGIEATRQIKKEFPDVIVIILTAFEDFHFIDKALTAGADGYISKDVSPQLLIEAIYKALDGERVFSKSILNVLNRRILEPRSESSSNINISLTKREQEILNYVAMGKTSQEIADILGISVRTVQVHRANIIQKLGLNSAAELIRFAIFHSEAKNK